MLYCLFRDANGATASEVADRFGLSRETVSKEARRLLNAGIIQWRSIGRSKVLTIVEGHPASSALRTLVDLTIGPLIDLQQLFDIDGVKQVFVFGSWARRHRGEPGPTPRDVDVLVVGTPDTYDVTMACADLSGRYGIDVNPMIMNSSDFVTRGESALIDEIVSGPLVEVKR